MQKVWVETTYEPENRTFTLGDSGSGLVISNNESPVLGSDSEQCIVLVIKNGNFNFKAEDCGRNRAKGLCIVNGAEDQGTV